MPKQLELFKYAFVVVHGWGGYDSYTEVIDHVFSSLIAAQLYLNILEYTHGKTYNYYIKEVLFD